MRVILVLVALFLAIHPTQTHADGNDLAFTPPRASGVYAFSASGYAVEVSIKSKLWVSIDGITMTFDSMPAREMAETRRLILLESRRLEKINKRYLQEIKRRLKTAQREQWSDGVTAYIEVMQHSRLISAMHEGVREFVRLDHKNLPLADARNNTNNVVNAFSGQVIFLVQMADFVNAIEKQKQRLRDEPAQPAPINPAQTIRRSVLSATY